MSKLFRISLAGLTLLVIAFIGTGVYYYMLTRTVDSRVYPWSQRRDSIQRPALRDYLAKVRRASLVQNTNTSSGDQAFTKPAMVVYLHFSGASPILLEPSSLSDEKASLLEVTLEWLPLSYTDVSEHLYRVTLYMKYSALDKPPHRVQVSLGDGVVKQAEASPFERWYDGEMRFLSDCWQEGQFVPPSGWQGHVPEIAWKNYVWVAVVAESIATLQWVSPTPSLKPVYHQVSFDRSSRVKGAVLAFPYSRGMPYQIRLVSSGETKVVAIDPEKSAHQPMVVDGYKILVLKGRDLSKDWEMQR